MEPQPTPELVCPRCHSRHRQIRIGKSPGGKQRYQCRDCARAYVPDPQPRGFDPALRQQAVRLYLEGNGFRRIARLLGVHHQSVVNWVRAAEREQPPAPLPASAEVVEMDELYALHLKRGTGCSSPPR